MSFRPGYGMAYPHYPPQPPQIMFGQMRMPGQGQNKFQMPPKVHQQPPMEPTPVFVGNISEKCTDEFMQKMLEECGKVSSWKRIQGTNGKMQGFGFCNFSEPEGTLRALRILNDFHLGDKKLTVKAEEKVRSELRRAAIDNRRREGKKDLKLKDDELPADEDDLKKDEEIRLKILHWIETDHPELLIVAEDGELSDRDAKREDKREAERKKDDRHRRRRSRSRSNKRSRRSRSRESPRHKRSRRSRSSSSSSSGSRSSRSSRSRSSKSSRSRTPQKQKSSGSKRRRDRSGTRTSEDSEDARERRIMRQQVKEKEQAYLSRLKRWESREKQRAKQYEREERKEKDRKKETQKEAKRLRNFMEDYDDEKDDPKYYKSSSLFQRKRDFEKEKEMDQKDRLKEQQEIEELKKQIMAENENGVDVEEEAKKRHKIKEDEALRKMRADSGSPNPHQPLGQSGIRAEDESSSSDGSESDGEGSEAAQPEVVDPIDTPEVVDNSTGIVGKTANGGGGWKAIGDDSDITINRTSISRKSETMSPMVASSSSGTVQPISARINGVFGNDDDEDDEMSKKKLKLFEITREERMQVMSAEEKKDLTRGIIKRIPTTKDELFATGIEWDYIDKLAMETRVKPWVAKKVQEFLGDEEKQLVDYICERIESRCSPEQILKDLAVIIDDDADMFVVKMWRLLVFEGQARKMGVNS